MSTRRRIGISTATTEAARRHLMQPVPCWEQAWVAPESAPPGSTLKVLKWVKTENTQQFSDDEGEVDEPLAPLPDDPEVVEGDEEMDQDEPVIIPASEAALGEASESNALQDLQNLPSKPSSPKPQPLSMSLEPSSELPVHQPGVLDVSLKPFDNAIDVGDVGHSLDPEDVTELDMSTLGPDGTAFEVVHDLTQLEGQDILLGGALMDQSVDPFAEVIQE